MDDAKFKIVGTWTSEDADKTAKSFGLLSKPPRTNRAWLKTALI